MQRPSALLVSLLSLDYSCESRFQRSVITLGRVGRHRDGRTNGPRQRMTTSLRLHRNPLIPSANRSARMRLWKRRMGEEEDDDKAEWFDADDSADWTPGGDPLSLTKLNRRSLGEKI